MPESLKLYLDQMFQMEVAQVLREQGYDVIRASETGQERADDLQILNKSISESRILITLDEHVPRAITIGLRLRGNDVFDSSREQSVR